MNPPIYIIDGARTPFLKARNAPGPFAAGDLATAAGSALLARQRFAPEQLDEVILGCASPSPDEVNIGRVAALLLSDPMVRWFAGWMGARSLGQRLAMLRKFRFGYLAPVIGIMKGLTDPIVGQLMGQTAENLAWRFGISRDEMDAYAVESHRRVAAAQDAGHFAEIVPLIDRDGSIYASDDGLRRDASLAGLAKLKPFFDKKYGRVTPGNSSQITDGAAWLVLASEAAVAQHGLTPIGRIVDSQWAALEPELMGLGPVHAATPILQRHGLGLNDLDLWELNEAFAAQVIGCLRAWQDDVYCRERLGLPGALGAIEPARLNIDGGAVALGHPVGASGVRIVLHLLQALRRTGGKRGIATICIGGGLGGAMLVEAL